MRTIIERNTGFTIIEMMVVMVVISILALMATTSLRGTSDKAYVVAMQSDLRNIANAQEVYVEQRFAETGQARFANRLGDLAVNLSNGVQIRMRGNQNGWSARATHQRAAGRRCAMVRGTIRPFPPSTTATEGRLVCD